MTRKHLWNNGEIVAGPFETKEDAWKAQRERLEQADDLDDVQHIRYIDEWRITEEYEDGTTYFTNSGEEVTVYIENGRDGWNVGLFDESESACPVIDGTMETGLSKLQAMCHAFTLVQHLEEYK